MKIKMFLIVSLFLSLGGAAWATQAEEPVDEIEQFSKVWDPIRDAYEDTSTYPEALCGQVFISGPNSIISELGFGEAFTQAESAGGFVVYVARGDLDGIGPYKSVIMWEELENNNKVALHFLSFSPGMNAVEFCHPGPVSEAMAYAFQLEKLAKDRDSFAIEFFVHRPHVEGVEGLCDLKSSPSFTSCMEKLYSSEAVVFTNKE